MTAKIHLAAVTLSTSTLPRIGGGRDLLLTELHATVGPLFVLSFFAMCPIASSEFNLKLEEAREHSSESDRPAHDYRNRAGYLYRPEATASTFAYTLLAQIKSPCQLTNHLNVIYSNVVQPLLI